MYKTAAAYEHDTHPICDTEVSTIAVLSVVPLASHNSRSELTYFDLIGLVPLVCTVGPVTSANRDGERYPGRGKRIVGEYNVVYFQTYFSTQNGSAYSSFVAICLSIDNPHLVSVRQ